MEVTKIPNPILSKAPESVDPERLSAGEYNDLIATMKKVMVEHNGVGLAANQVGQNLSIFVIDVKLATEQNVPEAYINPEITEYSKDTDELEEGCLSIPEYYMPINRSRKIKLKALDPAGNKIKLKVRGFLARVFQHETDHLNGLVIKDRFESQKKLKS